MPPDATELLRRTNCKLRSAVERFRPERNHCLTITPADLLNLVCELVQASECLRNLGRPPEGSELERESSEYASNLQKLKDILPDFHARLQAERSRLLAAQKHVEAAAAWAGASTKTL
jgi:hypothetical protein